MKLFVIAYLFVTVAFLILDGIWLGLLTRQFYARELGPLLRDGFLLLPAALFYLLYAFALVWFAVLPLAGTPLTTHALNGALIGLLAYGTYNLTNLATLQGWSIRMSIVDMCWGTVMSAAIATFAAWLTGLVTRTT